MTQYLGISMVVIVITLCIGILSTIVTENVLKQFEAHRNRVADRRWAELGKFILKIRENFKDEIDKILEKSDVKATKEVMKCYDDLIDEVHKKGMDIDDINIDNLDPR